MFGIEGDIHYFNKAHLNLLLKVDTNCIAMAQERKLKILMLEDNEDDFALVVHVLREEKLQFINELVDSKEEFCKAINDFDSRERKDCR